MDQIVSRPTGRDNGELAQFLKAMRKRISPADMGIPVSPRRRAVGLLREEVALAAGISATWYTWMEQGRPTNPSPRVLDALARALRLDATERAHLFRLAQSEQGTAAPPLCGQLGEPLASVLRGLAPRPAYAINGRWDVIAWNDAAARLLGGFDESDLVSRNLLYRLFLDSGWRRLFVEWETIVESAVGQFRASSAYLNGDAEFAAFIRELEQMCPEFSQLWNRQYVRNSPTWSKALAHPAAGRLVFNYATFRPDGAEDDLRFTIYTPADDDTERKFHSYLKDES